MLPNQVLDPTWPTDRVGRAPDLGVGVDTVGLRGPVSSAVFDHLPELRMRQVFAADNAVERMPVGGWVRLPVFAGSAFVAADLRNGKPEIRVEFSAPSILHGHNRDVLSPVVLSDVIEVTLAALDESLPGLPGVDEVRLTRLDVTRDIDDVLSTGDTLSSLATIATRAYSISTLHHRRDGHVQSIVRGSRDRWRSTTYDKGHELAEKAMKVASESARTVLRAWSEATQSRIRFESRLYSTLIKEQGLQRVDRLNGEALTDLASAHFASANIGALLSGGSRLCRVLTSLRPVQRRNVLAYLAAEFLGVDIELSHNPRDAVRSLCGRLKLQPHDLVAVEGEPRRLDFVSGRELRGDDALIGLV